MSDGFLLAEDFIKEESESEEELLVEYHMPLDAKQPLNTTPSSK
jgi:hypothetical protein